MQVWRTGGRWAVVLVTALLLFATSGFSLSRMTCLKSGVSVYTLGSTYADCGEEETAAHPVVRTECCTYGQVVVDQPELQSDRQVVVDVPVGHPLMPVRPVVSASLAAPAQGCSSRPPHRPMDERRSRLGVFRI